MGENKHGSQKYEESEMLHYSRENFMHQWVSNDDYRLSNVRTNGSESVGTF